MLGVAALLMLLIGAGTWIALTHFRTPNKLIAAITDGGGTIALTDAGALTGLSSVSPDEEDLIRTALRTGRLPAGPPLLPAASADMPALFGPAGTRVASDRPQFRWRAMRDARTYRVTVFDDARQEVAHSADLGVTWWRPEKPLPRGLRLSWQVTPGPPEPAQFEIVPAYAASRIEAARAIRPPSHLLLALLYAREGVRDEAATELTTLSAMNRNSPVVDSLVRSLDEKR
jgi:hypothetical protein